MNTLAHTHKQRKEVIAWLLLGLFSALALSGCDKAAPGQANAAATQNMRRNVEFTTITTGKIEDRRVYTGGLKASATVAMYPLLSERIVTFPVEEGTEVKAGEVIAQIRATGIRQSTNQMKAQIESLDATLAGMDRELSRTRDLYEHRIVPQQALDQLEATYQANLAQHKALQAGLGQLKVTAGNAYIRAPFAGVISGKLLEEGDVASPQVPLCHVVQMDPIRFEMSIIERDIPVVRLGMRVDVTVDAWPGRTFEGEVTRILPVLNPGTHTNDVRIEIPNPTDPEIGGRWLKPGMFGRAAIIVDVREDTPVVPSRALMIDPQGREGIRRVMVLEDGDIVREREVQLGITNDDVLEIKGGLSVGERIIVRGQFGIRDGEAVSAQVASADILPAALRATTSPSTTPTTASVEETEAVASEGDVQ